MPRGGGRTRTWSSSRVEPKRGGTGRGEEGITAGLEGGGQFSELDTASLFISPPAPTERGRVRVWAEIVIPQAVASSVRRGQSAERTSCLHRRIPCEMWPKGRRQPNTARAVSIFQLATIILCQSKDDYGQTSNSVGQKELADHVGMHSST